jgi:two-component system LytT family sensor kinase
MTQQTHKNSRLFDLIEKLNDWKVHHIIFWIAYFFFWVFLYQGFYTDIILLYKVTGVYLIAHAFIYYFTHYYLASRLLKHRSSYILILCFFLTSFLVAIGMYILLKWVISIDLENLFSASSLQVIFVFTTSNIFTPGILLAIKSFMENRKFIRKTELLEKQRLETELQFLKSQVNPHFLFNTINSIFVLIKIDPDKASETLIKLSNLLRSQLYEFSADKINIEKELEYLDNYIELEKIRKGNRLSLEFEKEGILEGFQLAPLMLIPFLENCFKHLSTHTDRPNVVKIKIKRNSDGLEATFYNTSEPTGGDKPNSTGGIGLANIKRRLELVYPNWYSLDIHKGKDEFTVNLKLRLFHD